VKWLRRLFGGIPCLRRRIIVNFVDGHTAIEGVLWEQRGDWLLVKSAKALQVGRDPLPMDGDLVIECAQVLFVQRFES